MPLLTCPGVFVLPVPEDWEVHGVPGDHYVFTRVDRRGSDEVRLAVFGREPRRFGEREGADRLVELLVELGVDPDDEEVVFRARYRPDAHRAFAWFPAYDAAGHDVDCLAAVVVLPNAVVAFTAMASPRRPEVIATAELLAASLTAEDVRGRR